MAERVEVVRRVDVQRQRGHLGHGDQQPVAEYLLGRGADVNWIGWGNQTPLDVAVQSEAGTLSEWLRHKGAKTAVELT